MFSHYVFDNKLFIRLDSGVTLEEAHKEIEELSQGIDSDFILVLDSEGSHLETFENDEQEQYESMMSIKPDDKPSKRSRAGKGRAI